MEITTTSKGQIVIPASIRRRLGIKEGTRLQVALNESENEIVLRPITREYIHSLKGMLRGKGLLKELKTERKKERERDAGR